MLDFLFQTSSDAALTVSGALITLVAAFIMGLVISGTYMLTFRKGAYSQSFILTLIMIPAIIAIIILLVGSNVARAFSLAGAFSIVRFRSAPGDPKDITYIFFAMAAGLACGVGLIGYALLFTVLLCLCIYLLNLFHFGTCKSQNNLLKITIPENLNYQDAFQDVLNQYTTHYTLQKVKTIDLGSYYELVYSIGLKKEADQKEFMDFIRCRNGNLNVTLLLDSTDGFHGEF